GWTIDAARFDWASFIANKDQEIARISRVYRTLLDQSGVSVFHERAVVKDAHTVHLSASNRDVTAETLLIATGGYPSRQTGAEGAECCITSDDAFHLKELPKHIVIVGGGYIALEFAHIFHGLGSQVTLVYRGTKILRGFDEDLRDQVQASVQTKGIDLLLETGFKHCRRTATGISAVTLNGDEIEADHVMLAIGRLPSTHGLGLENAGVALRASGRVEVDAYSRSSVPNIYAIGDVTGRIELTPVAIHEAMCFAKTVFGGQPTAPDHEHVPTAVFTRPEIGTVGMSEERALAQGRTIDIYKSSFRPLKNTLSGRTERMMMKLVVCAETQQVLGCHIFGPDAGEMIQLVAIALKMGATKAQFDATIAVHPTMAEELVTMRTKTSTRSPS
ncbi:MAG TPA: FAD-dependent oxidoreductase, partial [Micropepsaceae bacterium]|nr:FAD-dependent oxidoreductase [Micropepsaceae bacterium]